MAGVNIIKSALFKPCWTIVAKTEIEPAVVVDKVAASENPGERYDAASGQFTNLITAVIIDPTKAVRIALNDAAGVASLLTTAEAVITEIPKEEPAMSPMGDGGMGRMNGMGGMGF